MGLRNLFGGKSSPAKVNSILMISLRVSTPRQIANLKAILKLWHTYVTTSTLKYMLYNIDESKKSLECYFSPYTYDCFLKYYRRLIDTQSKGSSVPESFYADTILYENAPKRNKANQPVSDKNGQLQIAQVNRLKTYPNVKYDDKYDYASFRIYYLLFFSYSKTALHSLGNPRTVYTNNIGIAKLFKNIYVSEYKENNGKDVPKGSFATVPRYQSFMDKDSNAVFIPNLTTKQQKKAVSKARRDYNINIFNMGTSDSISHSTIKNANHYRQMHDRDQLVNQMQNKRVSQQQAEQQAQQQQSLADAKKQKAESDKWRASVASAANEAAEKKKEAEMQQSPSQAQSNSNVNSQKSKEQSLAQRQANEKKIAVHQAELARKRGKEQAKEQQNQQQSSQNQKSQATSQQPQQNQAQPQSQPQQTTQQQSVAKATDKNIDYSSVKEPFVLTDDPSILAKAVKSMISKKDVNQHKVHFELMDVDEDVPTPESPEVALRTGHLDSQRYVQEEINDFKKIANNFIKHEEFDLNLAERRSELTIKEQAYQELTKKIKDVVDKYTSDAPLEAHAVKYYKNHYHKALVDLRNKCDKKLDTRKKALKEEYNSKLNAYQDKIYNYFNSNQSIIENNLRKSTIGQYNKYHVQRNKAVNKRLRTTKGDAKKTLQTKLENHWIEFSHKASQASQLLYTFFVRQLKKNKTNWINTVSKLLEAQTKHENAKAKMQKLELKAEQTKESPSRNRQLTSELKRLRQYSNDTEKNYEHERNHFLSIKDKLFKKANENANLRNHIDELKNSINTSTATTKQSLQTSRDEIKRLHQLISQKNHESQTLNNSISALTQDKANYSTSVEMLKGQLASNKMQVNQYRKMLDNQREQALKQSEQYATLEQKYTSLRMAMDDNHISTSEASKRASLVASRTSESVAKSVASSFSASVKTQNLAQNQSFANMKTSLNNKVSLAKSKAQQAATESTLAKQSMANESMNQATLKEYTNKSISDSVSMAKASIANSLSNSAMLAKSSAIRQARNEAQSKAQATFSESASIIQSQASLSASLSARSVSMSASRVVDSANSVRASLTNKQILNMQAENSAQNIAKSATSQMRAERRKARTASLQAKSAKSQRVKARASLIAREAVIKTQRAKQRKAQINSSLRAKASYRASINSSLSTVKSLAQSATESAQKAPSATAQKKSLGADIARARKKSEAQSANIRSLRASIESSARSYATQSIEAKQIQLKKSASQSQSIQASKQAIEFQRQRQQQQQMQQSQMNAQQSPSPSSTSTDTGGGVFDEVNQMDNKNKLLKDMSKTNAKAHKPKKSHKPFWLR